MKKDDSSFLEIFQDPLITIIALVLLSTIWMILPSESTPVNPESYVILDEIDSLKKESESIEEKMRQLEMKLQQLKEEIKLLESKIKEAGEELSHKGEYADDVKKINQEIAILKNRLTIKKEELEWLGKELKKAKDELSKAKGNDNIERILAKIRKLNEDIEKKRKELSLLEIRIKNARQNMEKAKKREDTQKDLIARLQNELESLLEETKKLEAQIEKTGDKGKSGGGFKPTFESDKKPFYIELVNNYLFPVDDDHYDTKSGYLDMKDGKTVYVVAKKRKSSVSGEDINEIENPESDFYKTLEKLNLKEERIIFLLHDDSFEIFRKARVIALKKGIEIGWWPYEDEHIVFSTGGGGEGIGSTDKPGH